MRGPRCLRIGILLERRAAGLSEAERLEIERHLVGCANCARGAAGLAALAALARSAPIGDRGGPDDALIAGAFRQVEAQRSVAQVRTLRSPVVMWSGVAVTVAVGLIAVLSLRAGARPTSSIPTVASSPGPTPSLAILPAAEPTAPRQTPPVSRAFSAEEGAALTLDGVELQVVRRATLQWSAETSTLQIEKGTVRLKVPPRSSRPFRVATVRFVIEVLGTELEVSSDDVHMLEGTVRVLAPDGAVLVETLRAPSFWSSQSPADVLPPEPGINEPSPLKPARTPTAAAALSQGRRHLAKRRLDEARRAIRQALGLSPTRAERAEGLTLLAECAQSGGDQRDAARRYAGVAREYADLAAGEIALFAAAGLELRLHNTRDAGTHLRAYLRRYPTGRFRREVTEHLARLAEK